MKNNFNLNQLAMSWNEKQKPRRFGRYAAILIMLLTLGVGQMWATPSEGGDWRSASSAKVYFDNTNSSYSNVSMLIGRQWNYGDSDKKGSWGENFTKISGTNNLYYKSITCSHYTTFCFINASDWGWEENNTVTSRLGYCTNTDTPNDNLGSSTHLYVPASGSDNASVTHTTPSSYTSLNYTQTLNQTLSIDGGSTFSASTASIATVSVSSKKLNGNSSTTNDSGTIGAGYSSTSCAAARTATVTYEVSEVATGYEFVGWYDGSTQKSTSTTYTYNATSAKTITARFKETQYSLTFSHNGNGSVAVGGSTIPAGSTANVNHITTKTLVATPNTGYRFTGWTLTGTNTSAVTIADLTSTGASTTIKATNTGATVTAGFTKKTYSITLDKGDGDTDGSATIQRGDGALTISSHASRDEWNLVGYWTSEGDQLTDDEGNLIADVGDYTDGDGNWIYDDDATLTAHWSQTYSLTVNAGSNISSVTGSNADVTLGSKYAISATPNTGYSFSGWTASPAANGTFDDASSASTNVTVKNGNVIVTGAATENMTTVTVNVSPTGYGTLTLDASAFTPGNTTTAGVTTGHTIVATPSSGKVFHDWTVGGNATGTSTTNTYNLKGNGSAGEGTLTANFGVASGWYTMGDSPFGGWTAASTTKQLTYPYRGMSGIYYIPINMGKNKYFRFTDHTNQYNLSSSTSSDLDLTKGTIYTLSSNSTKASYSSTDLGDVWVVMKTSGTKKAWVQSAQTFYNVNLSGVDNTKGPTKVTLKTTSAFTKGDNVFETTQFANGETFTVTVTGVTGYIPSIKIGSADAVTWWKEQATYTADGTMSTSDVTVTITYTPTRSVTFAKTTGCSTLSATGPSSTAITTGTKVKDGTVITFAQTASTGYTFSKWYSNNTGSGGTQYSTSSSYDLTISSTAYTIYPLYTENMTTVNLIASPTGKGTFTSGGTVTSVSAGVTTHPTVTAVPGTGYHLTGTIWSESSSYISLSATNTASTTITATGETGKSADLTATFTPNTYTVRFHRNGGSGETVYQDFTYDVAQNLTANSYTKTGYSFAGWALSTDGSVTYANSANVSNLTATDEGTFHLYAKWTPKQSALTLDKQTSAEGYGSAGTATASASAAYDAAMPALTGTLPTAAQGYAFMGFYDETGGGGTKYYNADGSSAATWDKDTESGTTLYAYYKKAEITALTLEEAIVGTAETDSITVTPTIDPTPTGTTRICWEIQYSNGTALPTQPEGRIVSGNTYRFKAPTSSATYIVQATLKTGDNCASGTELSVYSTTFQVAGSHTVTVRYQDSDGRTIKASTEVTARPLEWTTAGDITPPTITGYKFDHWDAGDGVTIKNGDSDPITTTTTSSIQIKAVYDGTLTAVYAKKKLIFFNNTLGWSDVYVYFYNTNKYWSGDYGSGAKRDQGFGDGESEHPYWEQEHGHMTNIEGTNIWYFDYEAAGYSTRENVVFTEANQHDDRWFWRTKAVRRGDHISDLQLFVPLTTKSETKNETDYYNSGYWMNYPENTGYSLLIYNQKAKAGATKLYEFPFEFTGDFTMPMELVVDLEAGQTYGFEIKRADGSYYSNTGTITANATNQTISKDQSSYFGLQTTVAGNYTFSLYYSSSNYKMDVTYPVAVNDYRIVYTDLATWSKDAHTASWYHPSRVITKNSSATEVKKDTVSFFWSYGSSPAIAYQTCSAVAAGSASWSARTNISVSSYSSVLTKKGVYNFIFEQPAGGASISLVKVEPYTGKYYIRTDCAGSSKWVNYRSTDHEMTYSEYTETNHGYSHYFPHWVTTGQNVKFVIANDYSPCISDTLVEDKGTTIADITTEGNANAGRLNSGNASIRFMWKQADNKVSRAYISGSTTVSDRFLVLEGDAKMYDENGNPLSISGLNANEINLVDDQNFVYERTIKVNTGAKAKLTAKYNNKVQYFRGGSGSTAADSVELLGGDAEGKHTMRIVYDFKTNRLVTAYVPSGTIEDDIAIHADLMIVREHQEAGQQLLFNDGSLSEVHTVYGVMRFNRWTLNNKETTGSHDPVGDPKSAYERALYWISFPFDVNLSDVFGFGTYGTHWIIMEYDGAERAQKGYWADSDGFWKYVTNRTNKVLEAGKGYVLALDLDLMRDNDATFWSNNIEQVELFFPSAAEVNNISETNVQTTVDSHECTINRHTQAEQDAGTDTNINKNRTKADSHWNMIGIPSYANYGTTLKDGAGGSIITWNSNPYTNDLPFLYEWNMVDNTYTVQSGTTYPFKSLHAYMVQYHGNLYWSLASATPVSPIVARRTYAEQPQSAEFRLELQQNEKMVDQTFVKLSNDENASANFIFDEDLCKEYNGTKANIYTFIEGYIPAAGNTLPMSEQTTLVPVGVKTVASGDYTFAIPDGTNGVGVTLIDNVANTRTNLGLMDYTVNLTAGTIDGRFVLEISPIAQNPTDIEAVSEQDSAVRKVMIDGILYIVKGNRIYDATGALVK